MSGPIRPDLAPVGPALAQRNRRILAERQGWPEGAVAACEQIESVFPDWHPSWRPVNLVKGFERPAGFYAVRRQKRWNEHDAYGPNPATLVADIERRAAEIRR